MTEPETEGPAEPEAPSSEVVVRDRAVTVARRRGTVERLRGRLVELRQNPATAATLSAAATVGGALLVNGLRLALREVASSPATRTGSLSIRGYVLHEVHVFHHVVHHVVERPRPELRP
jgi:hypothetical protein